MTNKLHFSLANVLIIGQAYLWPVVCEDGAGGSE
jgi:hypothetical protein